MCGLEAANHIRLHVVRIAQNQSIRRDREQIPGCQGLGEVTANGYRT